MYLKKALPAAIAAAALLGLAQGASAEQRSSPCRSDASTVITSSTIVGDSILSAGLGWYISGICMENVTNVSLAKDDGAGFEEMHFTLVTNPANPDAKPGLLVAWVPRVGPGSAMPFGQYLVQVKKCANVRTADKCNVLDEKYLIVLTPTPTPTP